MVNCLVKFSKSACKRLAPGDEISATTINAAATSHWAQLDDVAQSLTSIIKDDPDENVRMDAIYIVCDWIYRSSSSAQICALSELLQAVGTRVTST